MSIRIPLLVVALTAAIALTGCSATTTPEPTSVATSDPAALVEEFGAALCPAGAADIAFNETWVDESSSLPAIVTAASTARDTSATAVSAIDALAQTWPEEYRPDLVLVADLYRAKGADYATIAEASSLAELVDFEFSDATAGNAAAQRIADALGEPRISC